MFRNAAKFVLQFIACATVVVACTNADGGVITATADTYIFPHSGLGGPNQSHGSDDRMFLIGPVGTFQASPLIRFDLSTFAGTTLTTNVNLELDVAGTHSGQATQSSV